MLELHPTLMPIINQQMCAYLADRVTMLIRECFCAHAELCEEETA